MKTTLEVMPGGDGLRYRHELKYRIAWGARADLCARMDGLLQRDPFAMKRTNGIYKIRSLYFDDLFNSSYEEKMAGVGDRFKYRIRVYNDRDAEVHLEKKIKRDNYVAKVSAELTREGAEHILLGDYAFLLQDPQPLCREFYFALTTGLQRPRVVVDYEREPFVHTAGDVRITFDMDVRAGVWDFNLFDPALPVRNVLPPGELILEVKYTELLPSYIRDFLAQFSCSTVSSSKYVLACNETMYAARPG